MGAAACPASGQVVFEGRVTDPSGAPLADVDLDFWDAQSGIRIDPSARGYEGQEDKTDVFGYYEMVVKPEVYHVRYEPPENRIDLAPIQLRNLPLGWDTVRDIGLPAGSRLQGRVVDHAGFPIADVDLDVKDPATGQQLATSNDDTGPDGRYGITVVPGEWDIVFEPPPGIGVGALQVDSYDLTGDAVLDVTLPRGFLLTGRIEREDGRPLALIDLDVEEPTGRRIPTANDDTDATGGFTLNVPEGIFHVFAVAPRGIPLASAALYHVNVQRDLDLGTMVLRPGVVVTGTALDPAGVPLAAADLDLRQPGTCDHYPTSNDDTDANGTFSLRVEPGTYDVVVNPASGSPLSPYRFEGVALTSDGVVDLIIPTWGPQVTTVASRVTDEDGRGLAAVVVRGEALDAGTNWMATTAEDGSFAETVIPGRYRIEAEPPTDSELLPLQLSTVDLPCGLPTTLALATIVEPIPTARGLRAWPNPWSTFASITLDMTSPEEAATLEIFDVTGRRVRTLFRGSLPGGSTDFRWDGTNDHGRPVHSGFYVLRLVSSRTTLTPHAHLRRRAPRRLSDRRRALVGDRPAGGAVTGRPRELRPTVL
jgi:hypothetical protein